MESENVEPLTIGWQPKDRVAVVTGSNKGIGLEIVKQLALQGIFVVLTARDALRGNKAMESLISKGLGLCIAFHQLDITNEKSIDDLAKWLKLRFGGIDILVNNAAINFNTGSNNSVDHADLVIRTNFYGTKKVTEVMLPLMRPSLFGARIINVSSRLGQLCGPKNMLQNDVLRKQLEEVENLTEDLIDSLLKKFLEEVKAGTWVHGGWPTMYTDYSVSKIALNAYTRFLARRLCNRPEGHKIYVNCYCPGWTKTDMTAGEGDFTVEEGADTAVWLSLLPHEGPSGCFFGERKVVDF